MGQSQNDRSAAKEKAIRNAQPERVTREQVPAKEAGSGDERPVGDTPA